MLDQGNYAAFASGGIKDATADTDYNYSIASSALASSVDEGAVLPSP